MSQTSRFRVHLFTLESANYYHLVLALYGGKRLLVDFQGILTVFKFVTDILKYFEGNVEQNLKLNFGKSTVANWSCGATLNGQFWIIGGGNEQRQVFDLYLFIIKTNLTKNLFRSAELMVAL